MATWELTESARVYPYKAVMATDSKDLLLLTQKYVIMSNKRL